MLDRETLNKYKNYSLLKTHKKVIVPPAPLPRFITFSGSKEARVKLNEQKRISKRTEFLFRKYQIKEPIEIKSSFKNKLQKLPLIYPLLKFQEIPTELCQAIQIQNNKQTAQLRIQSLIKEMNTKVFFIYKRKYLKYLFFHR